MCMHVFWVEKRKLVLTHSIDLLEIFWWKEFELIRNKVIWHSFTVIIYYCQCYKLLNTVIMISINDWLRIMFNKNLANEMISKIAVIKDIISNGEHCDNLLLLYITYAGRYFHVVLCSVSNGFSIGDQFRVSYLPILMIPKLFQWPL